MKISNWVKDQEKFCQIIIALIFIFTGVLMRLIPHPPNFAPILAIALFGGVYLSKKIALTLPIIAMVISDIFIGFYEPLLMASVYGSFILCTILGLWLKKHRNLYTIGGSAILSAFLFFFVTNFAVWAFAPWYAKTFSGMVQCYIMALPFFKNTLFSNLFYVTLFFGPYELINLWIKRKIRVPQSVALKNDPL